MVANTTVDAKGSKSILDQTTEREELRVTVMLSVLGFLKRKDFPKEELCVSIVSEYDEK
jgi:hypothetical protein